MKFLISTQMSNILRFQVYANNLLYISKFGIYLNDKILEQPNEFNVAYFWNKYAVFGNLENMAMVSLSNEEIRILNPQYSYYWEYHKQEGNQVLISQNRRKNQYGIRIADYHLLNLNNETLGERIFIEKPQISIFHHKGLFIEQNILKSLSLLTGEYEWVFDVSIFPSYRFIDETKPEEIKRLIGIWNNLLLVVLASGKLLALDIHTGEQAWLMTSDIYEAGGAIPLIDHVVLSEKEDKLYALHREYFVEIDLQKVSITRYRHYGTKAYPKHPFDESIGIPERLKNLPDTSLVGISVSAATYFQDHFYFTAYTQRVGGRDQNIPIDGGYVGVFNIQTEEVEWWYDLGFLGHNEKDYRSPQAPQVTADKLYVLDSVGTLHIFEREA